MKRKNKAIIILLLITATIMAFGILTIMGIISKMAWATFILSLIGKDVEVIDVENDADYFEFQGMLMPQGVWDVTMNDDTEMIIENDTAMIGIKVVPMEINDPETYLKEKSLELALDLEGSGMAACIEELRMCNADSYRVMAETEAANYMIIFWYQEKKIYTINVLYENREDADEVILSIACNGES